MVSVTLPGPHTSLPGRCRKVLRRPVMLVLFSVVHGPMTAVSKHSYPVGSSSGVSGKARASGWACSMPHSRLLSSRCFRKVFAARNQKLQ